MASNGAVIAVDVDALLTLAGRIQTARAALGDDSGLFGRDGSGIEHAMLRSTLDNFDERWSDKRHKMDESLQQAGETMRSVAESFRDIDDELAQCVLEGGSDQ